MSNVCREFIEKWELKINNHLQNLNTYKSKTKFLVNFGTTFTIFSNTSII